MRDAERREPRDERELHGADVARRGRQGEADDVQQQDRHGARDRDRGVDGAQAEHDAAEDRDPQHHGPAEDLREQRRRADRAEADADLPQVIGRHGREPRGERREHPLREADAGLGPEHEQHDAREQDGAEARHGEARRADLVVNAAEWQQHDEHDDEQREEVEEALDRDGAEQGARRHVELPAREHGARDLAEVREHVVAGEAREHGRLQREPAGPGERGNQVLPAFGLHAVVSEEADHAEGNLADVGAANFGGERGPVEAADREVQEKRAERGAEDE